jgi:DNA topoisomerase-1
MNLLIVESPGKIKKIQGFLGRDWKVMASFGHVRDLPKNENEVSPPDFKPHYVPTDKGKKTLAELAKAVKSAEAVYLATDPDREGEAIAWHLADALKLPDAKRVSFNEITETAVKAALAKPRPIDRKLVAAQEGRRVLDRLVGYLVSPEISSAAGDRLSAGRVQSPALRLVVEREAAIRNFKSTTHFGVELTLESLDNVSDGWRAQWNPKNWLEDGREFFQDQATADRIAQLRDLTVTSYQESEAKGAPPAPFTTSSLQQAASNALKFSPKRTMELAQRLYENSAITYMRTDSSNLSEEAIADIRSLAAQNDWPVPPAPRTWKSKAGAQEAHEAIRPTKLAVECAGANDDEQALYRLIRLRALASQLEDVRFAVTAAVMESELDGKKVVFEAKGRRLVSPGWRVILDGDQTVEEGEAEPNNPIPKLREGGRAVVMNGQVLSKKTRPPARFTEAGLIKKLEDMGIGRPSTFASILDNIKKRGYVKLEKGQLMPTQVGEELIAALAGKFSFLEYQFTKELEAQLDDIAQGGADYKAVVRCAHETLQNELAAFAKAAGHICPECGKPLRRLAKSASGANKGYDFWGCTGYPACKASFLNKDGKPVMKMD